MHFVCGMRSGIRTPGQLPHTKKKKIPGQGGGGDATPSSPPPPKSASATRLSGALTNLTGYTQIKWR